jgi:hypothetical protein
MECKVCRWHLNYEYIKEYRKNTSDKDFIICPFCESDIEQTKEGETNEILHT